MSHIAPNFSFKFLRQQVSIVAVLSHRGLMGGMRRRGVHWVGRCPIHGGDNPTAFVVDIHRNLWNCFTGDCGGGDVVELVRKLDRISYAEVAGRLSYLAGHEQSHTSFIRRAFKPYTRRLSLEHDHPFLTAKRLTPEICARYEVGAWNGTGMLTNCIGVRIHDIEGSPLGYAGRRLVPGNQGKWIFPRGIPKKELLYGYHHIPNPSERDVIVVEGAWDVLRLTQVGFPAVGLLGVHLSTKQRCLLSQFASVTLLLDGDPAGYRASSRISSEIDARSVRIPEGKDPDELTDEEILGLLSEFHRS